MAALTLKGGRGERIKRESIAGRAYAIGKLELYCHRHLRRRLNYRPIISMRRTYGKDKWRYIAQD